jgi:hypothetical protein
MLNGKDKEEREPRTREWPNLPVKPRMKLPVKLRVRLRVKLRAQRRNRSNPWL